LVDMMISKLASDRRPKMFERTHRHSFLYKLPVDEPSELMID
jgi:hypothetical protein